MRWVSVRPHRLARCTKADPSTGKTIQTIGIIGLLREEENYLGPHLIIAPLSTLSNWIAEFRKWAPSIPVVMYHGTPKERQDIHRTKLMGNLDRSGRPTKKFPVVCTSYEMIIQDSALLSKIRWEFIIIVCRICCPSTSWAPSPSFRQYFYLALHLDLPGLY